MTLVPHRGEKPGSRHRCPPYCHHCPDLRKILRETGQEPDPINQTMPGCMGGAEWGVDGCHCENRPALLRVEAAKERGRRRAELRRLDELVRAYPTEARALIDGATLLEIAR